MTKTIYPSSIHPSSIHPSSIHPSSIYPSNPLWQHTKLQAEIENAVIRVCRSGNYVLGKEVQNLEKETANYLGVTETIGCASGTDALLLSLVALGIGEKDEVITSSFSFVSAVEVICYLKATPVFVDINPQTFNLDPKKIQQALSNKTKAIIPVHLYGQCAKMDEITKIAKDNQLFVIEDAAQSFGAKYKNKQSGSLGDSGCFSFYPTKNLSCYGDGGLIALGNKNLKEKIKTDLLALRNHGSYKSYHYDRIGYNSRLDEIQAAILRIKLQYLNQWNQMRKDIAKQYDKLLSDYCIIPFRDPDCEHIFHQYTILTTQREKIISNLNKEEIYPGIYYPYPLHQQTSLKNKFRTTECLHTEKIAKKCLSLPIYPGLSKEQVERIAKIIIKSI